jgi:predicted MPP superfamily phosphohydrolase
MNEVFIFRACIGAFVALCQWYVFWSVRKHLFGKLEPVTSRVAYGVLCLIALLSLLAAKSEFDPEFLPGDGVGKALAIGIFCYMGLVAALSWFFILHLLSGFSKLGALPISIARKGRFSSMSRYDRSGCLENASVPQAVTHGTGGTRVGRRAFLRWGATAGLTGAIALAGKGLAQAYQQPVREEFDLFHPNLCGMAEDTTFLHISDIHCGNFFGLKEMQALVRLLNSIDADGLFVTGDVFHSWKAPVEVAVSVFKSLRPRRLGNLAVLGNHDYYAGEKRSMDSLIAAGFRPLRNEWISIGSGDAAIHIGGIDDPEGDWGRPFHRFPFFAAAMPKSSGLKILLSHRPSILPLASKAGLDLVCAGHLHGGQIVLPILQRNGTISAARLLSRYTSGWYREKQALMYLNRGLGLSFLPWRINCPPEITLLHLKPSLDGQTRLSRTQSPSIRLTQGR